MMLLRADAKDFAELRLHYNQDPSQEQGLSSRAGQDIAWSDAASQRSYNSQGTFLGSSIGSSQRMDHVKYL